MKPYFQMESQKNRKRKRCLQQVQWEKEEKQRSSTELLSECGSVEEEKRGLLNKPTIESET